MVFGTIIDWTVYRTLDLTVGTLWWVTSATGRGIYNAGAYLTGYGTTEEEESLEETQLKILKEQNELLKEQNKLLKEKQTRSKEAPF